MTTITFEKDIKIKKSKFKDLFDFEKYIEKNFFFAKLEQVKKADITPTIRKKMEEVKKSKASDFVNL